MNEVYLLLGSNEGKPGENLLRARAAIAQQCGVIELQSSLYETEAWGIKEQAAFLNQALMIKTDLKPTDLLLSLKDTEKQLGRVETTKWGPRVIDIDILFFGAEIVNLPDLKIPHPYIQERRFTLAPMAEIAPDFVHPLLAKTICELLRECKDNSTVKRL